MERLMLGKLLRSVNLRDLGGVRTADGAAVRRGRIFRSAALTDLARGDLAAVRALGIRSIVDLRRNDERDACPTPWEAMGCTDYWYRDHEASNADHLERMRSPDFTAQDSRDWMTALYAGLPYEQAEAYARLFRAIAHGAGPVLFHCAIGKDRTGGAAALILAAAGVGRDGIVADYVATESFDLKGSPHARRWPADERAVAFAPLLASNPAYLDAMFDALEQRSGTIEAYLRDTLGLIEAERAALHAQLIEAAV
jgi:protein-tyrosine phosphatase